MGDRVLHQALHGYAGGHRLLASSLDMPVQARETIAALSDLSGTRPQEGFESYLTGYPLPETDLFVFARTWMATEMPRPGCVWTHSLLIPQSELGEGVDLVAVMAEHTRPTSAENLAPYQTPLPWPRKVSVSAPHGPRTEAILFAVLPTLYSKGSPPVVVGTAQPEAIEKAVVGLWDQQWGELRKNFLFCTGSLAPRALHGRYFDLQLMPRSSARAASHDTSRRVFVVEDNSEGALVPSVAPPPPWVGSAVADIVKSVPKRSPFREWLRLAAASHPVAQREEAPLLFSLADSLSASPPDVDRAVSSIAAACEAPGACKALKEAVVGSGTRLPTSAVIAYLATSELPESFSEIDLQLEERAKLLWASDPAAAGSIIEMILSTPTQNGARMLLAMAEGMPVEALVAIGNRCRGVVYSAAVKQPAVLLKQRVWSEASSAAEAVAALAALPEGARPSATEMLLASRAAPPEILEQVLQLYGATALQSALESSEGRERDLLQLLSSTPWRRLVADQHAVMRTWLAANPPSLSLARALAEVVAPGALAAVPTEHWLSTLPDPIEPADVTLAISLFAVALSADTREAGALAGRTFATVHRAAQSNSLTESQWSELSRRLPGVPRWMEWDRCERLRRGFVDAFINRKPWLFVDFVAPFESDDSMLEAVCGYARSDERGRKFLKRLVEAIDSGRVKVGQSQRRTIEENARKRISDYLF